MSTDFPWKVSVMAFSPSNLSLSSVDTGNTIGTLWFTTPSSSSVAKCRHCSSSFSLMNPVRGEAQPSESTWSHWVSSLVRDSWGSPLASSLTAVSWSGGTVRSMPTV